MFLAIFPSCDFTQTRIFDMNASDDFLADSDQEGQSELRRV